jgi:membrane protease YdiL (CAAX protease family)
VRFFTAAFLLAWTCWLAVIAAELGWLAIPRGSFALLIELGLFSPALTALALSAREGGFAGCARLVGQFGRWRAAPIFWASALLAPALIRSVAIGAWVALGGEFPDLTDGARWLAVVTSLPAVLLLGGPLAEEPGWRGYALPRLQERLGALHASLLIGALTALWHAPLFLITVMPQSHLPFAVFFIRTVALAVISTWLYNGSRRSLLVVLLFHTAINSWPNALSIVTRDGALVPYLLTSTAYCALGAGLLIMKQVQPRAAAAEPLAA